MDQNNNIAKQISDEQVDVELDSILKEIESLDAVYQGETEKAISEIDSIDQRVGIIVDELDTDFSEIEEGSRDYEDAIDGLVMEQVGVIEEDLDDEE